MDYKDPFFAERGVDPDVAAVRGYRMWDGDNYQTIVAETFGYLPRAKQQWATYVVRQEPDEDRSFWGVTIPRHSAKGYNSVTPGLRPSEPVKLGGPKRHIHADKEPEVFVDILPVNVEVAYASPQRGQTKVFFSHSHGRTEEFAEHIAQFHSGTIPTDSHGHTFYVVRASDMRKHINQGKDKSRDAHEGVNQQVVHAHQRRAKYLYTPSDKFETPWASDHDHEDMTTEQLERHLMLHEHEGIG